MGFFLRKHITIKFVVLYISVLIFWEEICAFKLITKINLFKMWVVFRQNVCFTCTAPVHGILSLNYLKYFYFFTLFVPSAYCLVEQYRNNNQSAVLIFDTIPEFLICVCFTSYKQLTKLCANSINLVPIGQMTLKEQTKNLNIYQLRFIGLVVFGIILYTANFIPTPIKQQIYPDQDHN